MNQRDWLKRIRRERERERERERDQIREDTRSTSNRKLFYWLLSSISLVKFGILSELLNSVGLTRIDRQIHRPIHRLSHMVDHYRWTTRQLLAVSVEQTVETRKMSVYQARQWRQSLIWQMLTVPAGRQSGFLVWSKLKINSLQLDQLPV